MNAPEEKVVRFPFKTKLVCSGCGAPGEGSCGCGVAYVKAGVFAEAAVKANPEKSNRMIAEEIGVDPETIRRARKKSTDANAAVEKRTGKDGRTRAMPKPQPPKPPAPLKIKDEKKNRVAGIDVTVDPPIWQAFIEKARRDGWKSATALVHAMITDAVEPGGVDFRAELPKTAQEKLDAAMRQQQRKLNAEHADRMRGIDEEVRKRVVAGNKEYLATLEEMETKARENEKYYREVSAALEHPLTVDEWRLLSKCVHQRGIAAQPEDLDEAAILLNLKRDVLTGKKK